jgi:hypothetical protein
MVRQSDQEGTRLLSNVIGPGNRGIHAPNHRHVTKCGGCSLWNLNPPTVEIMALMVIFRVSRNRIGGKDWS